jgi:hypothetical protein
MRLTPWSIIVTICSTYFKGAQVRAVESESEGILGGVGVGKNVPTPTSI